SGNLGFTVGGGVQTRIFAAPNRTSRGHVAGAGARGGAGQLDGLPAAWRRKLVDPVFPRAGRRSAAPAAEPFGYRDGDPQNRRDLRPLVEAGSVLERKPSALAGPRGDSPPKTRSQAIGCHLEDALRICRARLMFCRLSGRAGLCRRPKL